MEENKICGIMWENEGFKVKSDQKLSSGHPDAFFVFLSIVNDYFLFSPHPNLSVFVIFDSFGLLYCRGFFAHKVGPQRGRNVSDTAGLD